MAKRLVMLLATDRDLIELVEVMLGELGVTVVAADNARKAIKQLGLIKANLLVIDTALLGALEVVGLLKACTVTKSIPLLALAHQDSGLPDQGGSAAMAAGADDVLFKPFDAVVLVEKVRKFTNRRKP